MYQELELWRAEQAKKTETRTYTKPVYRKWPNQYTDKVAFDKAMAKLRR